MYFPLRVIFVLCTFTSGIQLVTGIQANNDIIGVSAGARPWCIDVLSNDITTLGTQITAFTNGSAGGYAVTNAPPVFATGVCSIILCSI